MDLWNLDAARHSYQESLEVGLEVDRKPAIGSRIAGWRR